MAGFSECPFLKGLVHFWTLTSFAMLLILIFSLFIILCFHYKQSSLLFFILLGICVVLMGFNTENADYINYVNRYNWASYPERDNLMSLLDISYSSFQAFFKDLGVEEYFQFRIYHTIILFSIFGWFINKECAYKNLYLCIYLLFYILHDTIQIRNFTGFIALLPFLPLLRNKTPKSSLIYVAAVLFCATIHFSMISFLIFSFISIENKKQRLLFIMLFLLILAVFSSVISATAAFERADGYRKSSVLGALYGILFIVINYFLINKASLFHSMLICKNSLTIFSKIDYKLIRELNYFLLYFIPIYFVNASIGRVFRYISIINIIFLLNTIYMSQSRNAKIQWGIITFIYALFFCVNNFLAKPEVYMQVLNNNSILSWF